MSADRDDIFALSDEAGEDLVPYGAAEGT